ncbi:hypothetical protein E5082_13330 [Streptomyces griseoluteus]|uniref:Lipoprotein n=1 Tax=Streptomyces griseoluteus TaxID=29306 RepID=A0A4Z1DLU2_STRGP|nr:hypothetical protein [Streptomyces griseoluteus]TGN83827.1 hypothetical protein E5082_13330 [Streptomyces griseoluteus]GHF05526.1 hypothetical protein GCM10017776_24050 [Streptomyces griseoluteus]
MNRHLRKAVVASVAITAGLLMTACQSGADSATASGTSTTSAAGTATESPGSQDAGGSERQAAQQGSGADSSTGSSTGTGSGSGSGTVSPSRDTAVEGIDKGEGVNGTWFGNVSYLAPGKYTVSDQKNSEQEFLLAEDTEIIGYDDICGDPGVAGGTKCTEAQLETAAKKGVSAEVVIRNGIATSIRDDH